VILGKPVNIFFKQPRMVLQVASYLGPGRLEYELKELKNNFGLFFIRNVHRQNILDANLPPFSRRGRAMTTIYSFQRDKMNWYEEKMDTCLYNLDKIDSKRQTFELYGDKLLTDNYGYAIGMYELQLFASDVKTNVLSKESVLEFIRVIKNDLLEECEDSDIYDKTKNFECKLNLLSSFLLYNFDVETHCMRRLY
jgi:hypothetical protein